MILVRRCRYASNRAEPWPCARPSARLVA